MPTAIARTVKVWDIVWWAVACLGTFGVGVYAVATNPDAPNWAVILMASVVLAIWIFAFAYWYQVAIAWDYLQYVSTFGSTVGWTKNQYAVAPGNYAEIEEEVVTKLLAGYPNAPKALNGCIVLFREPKFFSSTPSEIGVNSKPAPWYMRKVSGSQSGILIEVGWNRNLHETALAHELGHRILKFHGVISNEGVEHQILAQRGL